MFLRALRPDIGLLLIPGERYGDSEGKGRNNAAAELGVSHKEREIGAFYGDRVFTQFRVLLPLRPGYVRL